jgi:hypothetical protein
MADHAELVAVGVAKVGPVVVGVVVWTQAWGPLIRATQGHGELVHTIHCGAVFGLKGGHLAVTRRVGSARQRVGR